MASQSATLSPSTKVAKLLESSALKILFGGFAMFFALQEEGEVIGQLLAGDFGAHHGVLVLGFAQALRGLVGMLEGAEKWITSRKH